MTHRLFWPVISLLALVVVNTVARPQFMKITVRDGELYPAPSSTSCATAPR